MEYDDDGNKMKEAYDRDYDGKINTVLTYEYDVNGNMIKKTFFDSNGSEWGYRGIGNNYEVEHVWTWKYDDNGRKIKQTYDHDSDGNFNEVLTYEYGAIKESWNRDSNVKIKVNDIITFEYEGNAHKYSWDRNGDGNIEFVNIEELDEDGRKIKEFRDWNGDGIVEIGWILEWDCDECPEGRYKEINIYDDSDINFRFDPKYFEDKLKEDESFGYVEDN
tara:strand:- start:138 stop:794 length:657 start_codon:yes stop_codon:yes gene_type:complete